MRWWGAVLLGGALVAGGCTEAAAFGVGLLLAPFQAEASRTQRARWAEDLFPALDCRPDGRLDAGELSRLRLTTQFPVVQALPPEEAAWQAKDATGDAALNRAEFMAFLLELPGLRAAGYEASRCLASPTPSPSPDEPASWFAPTGQGPLPSALPLATPLPL